MYLGNRVADGLTMKIFTPKLITYMLIIRKTAVILHEVSLPIRVPTDRRPKYEAGSVAVDVQERDTYCTVLRGAVRNRYDFV